MKYVDVVVDHSTDSTDRIYTYRCADDRVKIGDIVKVPFAKRRNDIKGYVFSVSDDNKENIKNLRDVSSIEKDYSLPQDLIKLSLWMKNRYMCRYIEAVKCMIPPGKKPEKAIKDPLEEYDGEPDMEPELTAEQQAALDLLRPSLLDTKPAAFLLNGVTSSGKTEVYLRATSETLKTGRDVIILVPEISLTPQTVERFTSRFGRETVAGIKIYFL